MRFRIGEKEYALERVERNALLLTDREGGKYRIPLDVCVSTSCIYKRAFLYGALVLSDGYLLFSGNIAGFLMGTLALFLFFLVDAKSAKTLRVWTEYGQILAETENFSDACKLRKTLKEKGACGKKSFLSYKLASWKRIFYPF